MGQKIFEKLEIKEAGFNKPENTYYVFKSELESAEVQANYASEAIEKSAIKNPLRVKNMKYKFYEGSVISEQLELIDSDLPPTEKKMEQ